MVETMCMPYENVLCYFSTHLTLKFWPHTVRGFSIFQVPVIEGLQHVPTYTNWHFATCGKFVLLKSTRQTAYYSPAYNRVNVHWNISAKIFSKIFWDVDQGPLGTIGS